MAVPILVLNGPNLNLLGRREPEVYGRETLDDIADLCREAGVARGLQVDFRQTNHEGALIDWIHEAGESAKGVVINPGAFTHTSVALRDAIGGVSVPVIEVHISNVFAREHFRRHSFISAVAAGVICGLGPRGYVLALDALQQLTAAQPPRSPRGAQ